MPPTHTESWSSPPGTVFGRHTHPYHKTLTCLSGSITFTVYEERPRVVKLEIGGRLELPAGTEHSAVAGPAGVSCTEVHRGI